MTRRWKTATRGSPCATRAWGEAERIARSGKLSDRESALLSPDIAFIHLHAGGLVAECGYCRCVVDEKWDFCPRCGVHFVDCRYVAEFGDLDA